MSSKARRKNSLKKNKSSIAWNMDGRSMDPSSPPPSSPPLLHFYKDISSLVWKKPTLLFSKLFTYLKANVFWPIERRGFRVWRDSLKMILMDMERRKEDSKNATANRQYVCLHQQPEYKYYRAMPPPRQSRHYPNRPLLNPDKYSGVTLIVPSFVH